MGEEEGWGVGGCCCIKEVKEGTEGGDIWKNSMLAGVIGVIRSKIIIVLIA